MNVCKICYEKNNNKIKCKSNCKNNDTDICNYCIINLNINNLILLKGNILINNEYIKNSTYYTNIMIYYICPYCNKISNYKLTDIIDKNNLYKLCINILKYMILKSNEKDSLILELINKNKKLEIKLNNKLYYKKYINICNILCIVICMKMLIIFIFVFLNKYTIYIK